MKKTILICVLCVFLCSCTSQGSPSTERTLPTVTEYDNTKIGWGFRKIKNCPPEVPDNIKEMLGMYDSYYVGDTTKKQLYLTFDEGYENGYTAKILDVLKKTKTPAAFFVTGQYIKEQPELVKRMFDEGHIVGNHSVNHPSLPDIDDEKLKAEITGLNDMYKQLTGQDMKYLRPPRGEFSERTLALTQKLGYKNIFWSSAYVDWDVNNQKGVQNAIDKTVSQFHNGNIILLHAVSKDNADALESIINEAKAQGYTFLNLDNL